MASLASLAAACAQTGSSRTKDAPIELSVPVDVDTFDPRFTVDYLSQRVSRLIHAGLVGLDPDSLEPRPYLARSWRWIDARTLHMDLREDVRFHSGAPFSRTLHMDLREDVRFHSGAPFTSHDVAASLAAYASPLVQSRHLRVVDAIAAVDEDGPHAVTIHLSRAHATLLTDLEIPILRADQATAAPDGEGALDGLGPYRVTRATRGDVLLEPAEGSVLPRPRHAIAIRTVHDDNARALRLLAGRADVATNVLTLVSALEHHDDLAIVSRPGANLTYMIARLDRGPLADVRVRRALSLGIDRSMLARTLFEGHVAVASTLIPPSHWAHTDLPAQTFDPAAARALVAEALPARPHFTLLTSTDRFRGTLARAIAQELADAGIDVEVVALELGTLLTRLNSADFELAILNFPEFTEPNVLRNFFHGSFVPPAGYNRARVHDAALDALLDEGDQSPDPIARRAIYAKIEARIRDQAFLIPLWNEDQVVVTSTRARTFKPSAEGRWLSLAQLP